MVTSTMITSPTTNLRKQEEEKVVRMNGDLIGKNENQIIVRLFASPLKCEIVRRKETGLL